LSLIRTMDYPSEGSLESNTQLTSSLVQQPEEPTQ
jgi:hypothetical protein